MSIPTLDHYLERIDEEVNSVDTPGPDGTLTVLSGLSTEDQAWLRGVASDYASWNLKDPFGAQDGPYLQYLRCKMAAISLQIGRCPQLVDYTNAEMEQKSSQIQEAYERQYKMAQEELNERLKLGNASAGPAVGVIAATAPLGAIQPGFDPNLSIFRGDPRYRRWPYW